MTEKAIPDLGERAQAILEWVVTKGIRVRYAGGAVYRAYVAQQNGRILHIGPEAFNPMDAVVQAYEECRQGRQESPCSTSRAPSTKRTWRRPG